MPRKHAKISERSLRHGGYIEFVVDPIAGACMFTKAFLAVQSHCSLK